MGEKCTANGTACACCFWKQRPATRKAACKLPGQAEWTSPDCRQPPERKARTIRSSQEPALRLLLRRCAPSWRPRRVPSACSIHGFDDPYSARAFSIDNQRELGALEHHASDTLFGQAQSMRRQRDLCSAITRWKRPERRIDISHDKDDLSREIVHLVVADPITFKSINKPVRVRTQIRGWRQSLPQTALSHMDSVVATRATRRRAESGHGKQDSGRQQHSQFRKSHAHPHGWLERQLQVIPFRHPATGWLSTSLEGILRSAQSCPRHQ